MSRSGIFGGICVAAVLIIILQNYHIERQKTLINILEVRAKINDEETRELHYALLNRANEDSQKSLAKLDGILSIINNDQVKKEYMDVWHDGYYRGLAQEKPPSSAESGATISEK